MNQNKMKNIDKIIFNPDDITERREKFMKKIKHSTMYQDVDSLAYYRDIGIITEEALFNLNSHRIRKRSNHFEKVFSRFLSIKLKSKYITRIDTFNPPSVCFTSKRTYNYILRMENE